MVGMTQIQEVQWKIWVTNALVHILGTVPNTNGTTINLQQTGVGLRKELAEVLEGLKWEHEEK